MDFAIDNKQKNQTSLIKSEWKTQNNLYCVWFKYWLVIVIYSII